MIARTSSKLFTERVADAGRQNRRVQIMLLGPLEVRAASGVEVDVGGARLRTLLILLALDAGRVVTTGRLADGLWPHGRPAAAANALQALVSRLRRAVPGVAIGSHPAGYRLDADAGSIDVTRFERLVAAGRAELAAGEPARAAETLSGALALWRGPALADVADAEFARVAAARLDELRLAALTDRAEARLRLGAGAGLVAELEGLLAAHPLREPLVGALMRAQCAAGRPGAAIATYAAARSRLADVLGADPSPALTALHVAILRGDLPDGAAGAAARPPAPQPSAAPPTNLGVSLTSFVGRAEDADRVRALLATSRLVTLTGPGGAGKTRLAVESARALLPALPGGVWMVELAPVTDPADVVAATLAALGLREHAVLAGGRLRSVGDTPADPIGRLLTALSGRRALLVLDNCEHLLEAAARLAERVLGACPGIRVLATSREPLAITGECLWPVEPLGLPPSGTGADPVAASTYPAVRLFADRAAAVRPGFAVDGRTALAVVRICRALDGMPLAIELAAARLRAMTPDQVAARLDDWFRLLVGGSRTALPRHRTLAAVVDWSWELADDAERALWRRFAIFPGGATQEAAARVCGNGGDAMSAGDTADVLAALVEKSLVVIGEAGPAPRYRMLETIREYGLRQLDAAGEREPLRAAHARYFLELAETAEPLLRGRDQLTWLTRLADEQDNLTAAVRGAAAAGDAASAVRLAAALGWYWWLSGRRGEGADLAVAALALPGPVPPAARAGAALMASLNVFDGTQNRDTAKAMLLDAVAAGEGRAAENPILALLPSFQLMIEAGGSMAASTVTALSACYDTPDLWVASTARLITAYGLVNLGLRNAEAARTAREALAGFRTLGERWGQAIALGALGELADLAGDHTTAVDCYEQALSLSEELGTPDEAAQFGVALARELWWTGERDRARDVLARARLAAERTGLPDALVAVAFAEGELVRLDGDLVTAQARLRAVADHVAAFPAALQFHAMIEMALAQIDLARGETGAARARLAVALADATRSTDAPILSRVLVVVADLALAEGDPVRSATLLGAAASLRGSDHPPAADPALTDAARVEAAALAALGEAGFTQAFQRGRQATVGTAAALAGLTPAV
jgi:predicted ATPase/DNA-binding SARP family transcriptional activator